MPEEAFARVLAERLNEVLPPGLSLVVTEENPYGRPGWSEPCLVFRERGRVRMLTSLSDYPNWFDDFLGQLRDEVAENTYQPWPATMEMARGKREPFPMPVVERESDEIRIAFVYRETGERVLELPPVPLSEPDDSPSEPRPPIE